MRTLIAWRETFAASGSERRTMIAEKLGIEKTAMIRVRAGISYALSEAMGNGHCGLPRKELIPLAIKLLEVPDDLIHTAIELEMSEGTVTADTVGDIPCVFLSGLYHAEKGVADRFQHLNAGPLPWPDIDAEQGNPLDREEDWTDTC